MPSFKTSSACDRAVAHSRVGNFSNAIGELERHLLANADDGRAWELLGELAYAQDNLELAQLALEHASALVPLARRGQLMLARCYDQAKHCRAADAVYRHVATLADLETELLEPLASGLGRYGHFELALEVCRRAAQRMPDNVDPLIGIVHYMRRLRRPLEQILPAMFRVHHLEPDRAEYRVTLAWMLHEVGNTDEAAYLLEGVPYESFSCIRCLTLMQTILENANRGDLAAVCRARLNELAGDCPGRGCGSVGE